MSLAFQFASGWEPGGVDANIDVADRDRKRDAGTPVGEPSHKKARLESEVAEVQDEITSSNAASVAGDEMEDVVESKAEEVVVPKPSNTKEKGKGKAKGNGGFKENPYTFLSPEDPILQGCMCVSPHPFSLGIYETDLERTVRG